VAATSRLGAALVAALWGAVVSGSAWADGAQPSAQRGQAVYAAKCGACHSVDDNRVGPRHQGVLGRKAGSVADYDYSAALKASRVVWNRSALIAWLTDPEKVVPGQKMGYRLGSAQERADVVAYLATLK
jgi:cytochrome c